MIFSGFRCSSPNTGGGNLPLVGSSSVESLSAFSAYTSYKHSETSFTSLSPRSSRCLVGSSGVEPPTSCLSGMRSNLLSYEPILELPVGFLHLSSGGDEGIRTLDPLLAGQVLSQLSYTPRCLPGFGTLKIEQRNPFPLRLNSSVFCLLCLL